MMKVPYRKLHCAFQQFKFITFQGSLSYLHNHSIMSFSHDLSTIKKNYNASYEDLNFTSSISIPLPFCD